MTSTDSTTGVSRLPSRPRSRSTLATTPDDETQVTPARATAAIGPQPSRSATAAPGRALRSASSEARDARLPQALHELVGGVLEPEHGQQEDDPDLRADLEEPGARIERQQTALADGEPGEQVEGDRRDAEPRRDATQDAEHQQERTDLDEQHRGLVHALSGCRGR